MGGQGSGRKPNILKRFTPERTAQVDMTGGSKPLELPNYSGVKKFSDERGNLLAEVKLNEIENPDGNQEFTMSNKLLAFRYTAPTPAGDFAGAFEIEASGGFTGNLFHVHQHTGNPGATRLLDIEAEDSDVTCLRIQHTQANGPCVDIDGALTIDKEGDLVTTGTLTGNLVPNAEMDAGAHTIGFTQQTATGDGTTTIDWRIGNKFYFTFGAQNDTFTFTAPSNPCNILLVLKQDGTGSRLATWPGTVLWPGGAAPTLSTGIAAVDIIAFYYDGTNYFGVDSLDFS